LICNQKDKWTNKMHPFITNNNIIKINNIILKIIKIVKLK